VGELVFFRSRSSRGLTSRPLSLSGTSSQIRSLFVTAYSLHTQTLKKLYRKDSVARMYMFSTACPPYTSRSVLYRCPHKPRELWQMLKSPLHATQASSTIDMNCNDFQIISGIDMIAICCLSLGNDSLWGARSSALYYHDLELEHPMLFHVLSSKK
jgi:hypothetical protein